MWLGAFFLLPLCISALDNGLALTPPMGWRSWNFYRGDISQAKMMSQVEAIATRRHGKPSLLEVGYNHVGLDDAWQLCGAGVNHSFHNQSGYPIINTTRFPNMRMMTEMAKKRGVKMGWYANNCECGERETAPGGHVKQDAEMAALLGFDSIKVDGCGPAMNMTEWAVQLNVTGRPMLVEDCLDKSFWAHDQKPLIPTAEIIRTCPGNFYRISQDIAPQFYSAVWNVNVGNTLLSPYQNATHPASRPGCWSYPDMLQVGNIMTQPESRTHFALWCITSAPLILGFDLTNKTLYDQMYPIVTNSMALDVNQLWAGSPGVLVANSTKYFEVGVAHGAGDRMGKMERLPEWQIWSKPLPPVRDKSRVAALIINLSEKSQDVTLDYAALKLGETVEALNVWTGKSETMGHGHSQFKGLEPHDGKFLVLSEISWSQDFAVV